MLENSRHGSRRDPRQAARIIFCMGLIGAVLLAPLSIVDRTLTLFAFVVFLAGAFVAVTLYGYFSRASLSYTVSLILTSTIVIIGTYLFRRGICFWIQAYSAEQVSACLPREHSTVALIVSMNLFFSILIMGVSAKLGERRS